MWATLLATYTLVSACFPDTWTNFSFTNGRLITLDFGHVSGVPVFEALPSHWLDIPKHFMKGRNDPLDQCINLCLWTTLLATYTLVSACLGDTWANFSSTNGRLITLDFGHVSGVTVFEALPSGWLDIPKHFMKGRNDPLGSGLVVALCGFVWLRAACLQ